MTICDEHEKLLKKARQSNLPCFEGSQKLIATGGNGEKLTPVEGEAEAFDVYVAKGEKGSK